MFDYFLLVLVILHHLVPFVYSQEISPQDEYIRYHHRISVFQIGRWLPVPRLFLKFKEHLIKIY